MAKFFTFLLMVGLVFPALLDAAQDGTGTNRLGSTVFKSGVTVTIGDVPRTNWPSGEGSTNVFSVGTNGLVPGPATENDGLLDADGTWMGKTNITVAMSNFYNLLLRATPIGAIQMYGGSNAPMGWKKCDGASYTTNAEPSLFAVVGYTYGGSAANFNVPNLVQRFPYGGTNDLGTTGGVSTVTLVSNNIPAHVHNVDPPSTASGTESADHVHSVNPPSTASGTESATHQHSIPTAFEYLTAGDYGVDVLGSTPNIFFSRTETATHTHTTDIDPFNSAGKSATHTHTTDIAAFNSGSSGGGAAFTNLPPYIVVNYIIFAGK